MDASLACPRGFSSFGGTACVSAVCHFIDTTISHLWSSCQSHRSAGCTSGNNVGIVSMSALPLGHACCCSFVMAFVGSCRMGWFHCSVLLYLAPCFNSLVKWISRCAEYGCYFSLNTACVDISADTSQESSHSVTHTCCERVGNHTARHAIQVYAITAHRLGHCCM